MMSKVEDALKTIINPVPRELVEYFEGESAVLSLSDCIAVTKEFRDFHPVVQCFQGLILDDANTSDYHIYLSRAGVAGSIFFLSHDGDSRIVFPSLAEFVHAAETSIVNEQFIEDLHPEDDVVVADQKGLSQLIASVLDKEDEDYIEQVVVPIIPSMDLSDLALLERLAKMENFFVVEAVASTIAERPNPKLLSVAEICAKHEHPQAASPGKRAMEAIAAMR